MLDLRKYLNHFIMKLSSSFLQVLLSAVSGSLLTLIILTQGCNQNSNQKAVQPEFDYTTLENYEKEGSELPVATAMAMVKAYKDQLTKNCPNLNDSMIVRSVHFEFGPLMAYIQKMRKSGASGLRIYFSNYMSDELRDMPDETGRTVRKNLKDYNTMVFVATIKKNNEVHDMLKKDKTEYLTSLYQPYNGGVSCPPYPPSYCKGQGLLELSKDPSFKSDY